jgi:hypothetical protein
METSNVGHSSVSDRLRKMTLDPSSSNEISMTRKGKKLLINFAQQLSIFLGV